MYNSVIIRYGEIGIKGRNRILFEKQLLNNVREMLFYDKIKFKKIYREQNRIIIDFEDAKEKNLKNEEFNNQNKNMENEILKSLDSLKKIFGITSFSPALKTDLDIENIKRNALLFYNYKNEEIRKEIRKKKRNNKNSTFRVTTQRINKNFKLNSQEINQEVGAFVVGKTNAKVDLETPEIEIGIEIMKNAYLFLERIKGLCGLPVFSNDFFLIELKNKNSLLATLYMMKRGLKPIFILKRTKEKIKQLKLLESIKPFLYGRLDFEFIDKDSNYKEAIVKILNEKNAVFVSEIIKLNRSNIKKLEILKKDYGIVLAPLMLMKKEKIHYYKKLLTKTKQQKNKQK
jgi:thiamine biosynthesis protein ThiI